MQGEGMKSWLLRYRKRVLLGAVALLIGIGWLWPSLFPEPVEFMTVPVTRQDIRETVLATGSLEGRKQG